MKTPTVSVIVVNFNAGKLLTECVHSVLKSVVSVQVLVSDNGSTDGSIQHLKNTIQDDRLHIHLNHANLGFAKGGNIVLPLALGEYILFLNPDCLMQSDVLERLVCKMKERPDVGMSGCLILNPDGSEQAGARRRVPTPWRSVVKVLYLNALFPNHPRFQNIILSNEPLPESSIEVEAISGAFMLVRRTALEEIGLLDEGYFLHCEDLDWCMRFRSQGWKVLFVPDVEVVHAKGICSHSRPVRVEWHKHKGMLRFYGKFFRHQYPMPLMIIVIIAVWLRFLGLVMFQCLRRLSLR